MEARSIVDKNSAIIDKNYEQFKQSFKNCYIRSIEKPNGRIYNKIKKEYIIKEGDNLIIKGNPSELFKIGIYEII